MPKGRAVSFVTRLLGMLGRRGDDPEFDAELRNHLDLLAQRYVRQGMSEADADAAARRQFGNTTRLREERSRLQTIASLESIAGDVRHAWRSLRRSPSFTAAVVVTLGLGIGANTALFSVFNAVLVKPLPYSDPDRIIMLWEQIPPGMLMAVAPANFVDLRAQTRTFSEVAAINPFLNFVASDRGEPLRLAAAAVSWNFFPLLGTQAAIGRGFLPEEDRPGRNRVAILSYGTWAERFGARPDIVGTELALNGIGFTVVGVLPRDFEFVGKASDFQARNRFDVWVPLALPERPSRGTHPLRVFARLKPAVTLVEAQADLDVVASRLARAYPEDNRNRGMRAVTLRDQVTGDARPVLFTLLGAVGFVLLIACGNVANLLLSRGQARQKELIVRAAIGASLPRLAQQLLVESVLMALAGGALGVALAFAAINGLAGQLPPDLSRSGGIAIDASVIAFTAAISVATGPLFGLAPLFQMRRVTPSESLQPGHRVVGSLHTRLRNGLVVAQLAVTLLLLIGAGLLGKSLWKLLTVPVGFQTDRVLTARLTLPRLRYPDPAQVSNLHMRLLDRLRGTPGVQSVGMAAYLPLSGEDNGWSFFIEGRPALPTGFFQVVKYRPVSDGYFEALGMPVVRGRPFAETDAHDAPFVAIINESMAREYWGKQDPVGQRIRFGAPDWRTVIGVVGDVRHEGLDRDPNAEMYVPFGQAPQAETSSSIVVRTAIDAASMTDALRAAVASVDPAAPVDQFRAMSELVSSSVGAPRFRTLLLAAFALLALVMASVGIYGVTNYSVSQRTREFGIYLALGATAGTVARLVLRQVATPILAGLGLGIAASIATSRVIARFLYGVEELDPLTFVAVPLFLACIAFLASYVPARRATQVDPMVALRYE
jgi:putative ABC transport system permease protein